MPVTDSESNPANTSAEAREQARAKDSSEAPSRQSSTPQAEKVPQPVPSAPQASLPERSSTTTNRPSAAETPSHNTPQSSNSEVVAQSPTGDAPSQTPPTSTNQPDIKPPSAPDSPATHNNADGNPPARPRQTPDADSPSRLTGKAFGAAGLMGRTNVALHDQNMTSGERALHVSAIAVDSMDLVSNSNLGRNMGIAGNVLGVVTDTARGFREDGAEGAAREGTKSTASIAIMADKSKDLLTGKPLAATGGLAGAGAMAGRMVLANAAATTISDAVDYVSGKKELTTDNVSGTAIDTAVNLDPLKAVTGLVGGATKLVGVDTGIQNVSVASIVDVAMGGKGENISDIKNDTQATYAREQQRFQAGLHGQPSHNDAPNMTDYKHLTAIRHQIARYLPDGGKIDGHDIRTEFDQIDMTKPENYMRYKNAINRAMVEEQKTMQENASWVPRWARGGESANRYNDAESQHNLLAAAEKEFGMFESRMLEFNRDHKAQEPAEGIPAPLRATARMTNVGQTTQAQEPAEGRPASLRATARMINVGQETQAQEPAEGRPASMDEQVSAVGTSRSLKSDQTHLLRAWDAALKSGNTEQAGQLQEMLYRHYSKGDGMSSAESLRFQADFEAATGSTVTDARKKWSEMRSEVVNRLGNLNTLNMTVDAAHASGPAGTITASGTMHIPSSLESVYDMQRNRAFIDTNQDGRMDAQVSSVLPENVRMAVQAALSLTPNNLESMRTSMTNLPAGSQVTPMSTSGTSSDISRSHS